ncbi:uncharacterized protein [Macaca fascicularis]|uniref:uncharacterized protein n=1 Tax=Macaca fascicularis TaxID=9541 RepID=UPI0032B063A6
MTVRDTPWRPQFNPLNFSQKFQKLLKQQVQGMKRRSHARGEPGNGEMITGCDLTGAAPLSGSGKHSLDFSPLHTRILPWALPGLPDSAMGCRLLCCVTLCLLQAGSLDTAVSQTPKYLVTQTGKEESLKCEQNLGHDTMYWYKQDSKKLLKIMFSYNNKKLFINETVPNRFSPDSPDKARLILHIKPLELGDSAVYFCASSQGTALQSHRIPVHKPPSSARKLWASVCTCTQGSSLHCLMASDGVSVCSTDG